MKAQAFSGAGEFTSESVEYTVLNAVEHTRESKLAFSGAIPGKPVSLRVIFGDSLGVHALEFPFVPAEQNSDYVGLLLIGAVALLVMFYVFRFGNPFSDSDKSGGAAKSERGNKGQDTKDHSEKGHDNKGHGSAGPGNNGHH